MIILGADHAGYKLKEQIKEFLIKQDLSVIDVGAFKIKKLDNFSDYVRLIKSCFKDNPNSKIIAVCGSGVGMNIGLNRHMGIRCVVGHTNEEVRTARLHNDVNALALGGRVTSFEDAKIMVMTFLLTSFLGGKYKERMDALDGT